MPLVRQSCGEDDKKVVMRITPNSEQLDMSPGNPPRGDKLQAPGYADVDAGPPDNHAVREVQQTGESTACYSQTAVVTVSSCDCVLAALCCHVHGVASDSAHRLSARYTLATLAWQRQPRKQHCSF